MWDVQAARTYLWRFGFGATAQEIARAAQQDKEAFVESLLPPSSQSDALDPELRALLEEDTRLVEDFLARGRALPRNERRALFMQAARKNRELARRFLAYWLVRLPRAPYPLHEKLVLFWHGHFTTAMPPVRRTRFLIQQYLTFRKYALGNFGEFVLAISQDPAMQNYLDLARSRMPHPNENFARELLELYTLGEGQYTEADVQAAARAFTGWTHDPFGNFVFREEWHDFGPKTFLGETGPWNGDDIVRIILRQPACAQFIVRKLLRHFVHPDPPNSWVQHFAALFRRENYELRPLMRALLEADLLEKPENQNVRIKDPLEFVLGTLRLMGIELPGDILYAVTAQLGMALYRPPNVKGWPGGRAWISSASLTLRWNFLVALVTGRLYGFQGQPRGKRIPVLYHPQNLFPEDRLSRPDTALEALVEHFLQVPLPASRYRGLQEIARSLYQKNPPERAVRALTLYVCAQPEYQVC